MTAKFIFILHIFCYLLTKIVSRSENGVAKEDNTGGWLSILISWDLIHSKNRRHRGIRSVQYSQGFHNIHWCTIQHQGQPWVQHHVYHSIFLYDLHSMSFQGRNHLENLHSTLCTIQHPRQPRVQHHVYQSIFLYDLHSMNFQGRNHLENLHSTLCTIQHPRQPRVQHHVYHSIFLYDLHSMNFQGRHHLENLHSTLCTIQHQHQPRVQPKAQQRQRCQGGLPQQL